MSNFCSCISNTTGCFDGSKVFFTSDTHFYHKSIISFTHRPFSSIEEMNDALIENWNSVVPKDGIVFHLGDFCFGGPTAWNRVIRKLNGKIYLILGNHDIKNLREGATWRFEGIFQQMYILVDGQRIWLNHCPFLCYGGAYNGSWQLFGHVHSGPDSVEGLDIPRLVNLLPTQYDVGVDNNNYRPVSFYEVKEIIEGRSINCG